MAECIKFPSKESLSDFHNDINNALERFQRANLDVNKIAICGSAWQIMLNFPHQWMGKSAYEPGVFVATMADQAQGFVELRMKADKEASGKVE